MWEGGGGLLMGGGQGGGGGGVVVPGNGGEVGRKVGDTGGRLCGDWIGIPGMGAMVAQKLGAAGHTVIGVDIKQADIVADLSHREGRRAAARRRSRAIIASQTGRQPCSRPVLAPGQLPTVRAWLPRSTTSASLTCLTRGCRHWPPLPARRSLFSRADSTTTTPAVPARLVRASSPMTPIGRFAR